MAFRQSNFKTHDIGRQEKILWIGLVLVLTSSLSVKAQMPNKTVLTKGGMLVAPYIYWVI
jgi:hypothetical protein